MVKITKQELKECAIKAYKRALNETKGNRREHRVKSIMENRKGNKGNFKSNFLKMNND